MSTTVAYVTALGTARRLHARDRTTLSRRLNVGPQRRWEIRGAGFHSSVACPRFGSCRVVATPWVALMPGVLAVVERPLDLPAAVSSPRCGAVTDSPSCSAGNVWVERSAVRNRDAHLDTRRRDRHVTCDDPAVDVDEVDGDHAPFSRWTRAVTRPDGTSMRTSAGPVASASTRPVSTAQTPSAMVPCPHAVEKPSLCQNRTPRSAPASSGGTTSPPYMSAWPRGSQHRTAHSACTSADSIARARPSATVAPAIGTGGSATIRNGSPPVW